uniref:Uncharacterized protein n=1 Tax=Cacopsylla melanoneura TaxID=428564 RepID=A0A8D9BUJ4_9HEMI
MGNPTYGEIRGLEVGFGGPMCVSFIIFYSTVQLFLCCEIFCCIIYRNKFLIAFHRCLVLTFIATKLFATILFLLCIVLCTLWRCFHSQHQGHHFMRWGEH